MVRQLNKVCWVVETTRYVEALKHGSENLCPLGLMLVSANMVQLVMHQHPFFSYEEGMC
jgi:hypothetical protein